MLSRGGYGVDVASRGAAAAAPARGKGFTGGSRVGRNTEPQRDPCCPAGRLVQSQFQQRASSRGPRSAEEVTCFRAPQSDLTSALVGIIFKQGFLTAFDMFD